MLLRAKALSTLRAICRPWGDVFFQNLDDVPQTLVYTKDDADGTERVLVVAVCPPEYSAAMLTEVARGMQEMFEPWRLLVVIRGDGAHAKVPKNAPFEFWTEEELCCNIAEHALQYSEPHVLTAAEEADVLGLLSLQRENLTRLTAGDPFVKFHGLRPGAVIRVSKPRETGVDVKYLLVDPK